MSNHSGEESGRKRGEGNDPGARRGFLRSATVAIGGLVGAVLTYPLLRYALYPIRQRTVSSTSEPMDVAAMAELPAGGDPQRVVLVAAAARDAWASSKQVTLGSAWVRRLESGTVEAISAVCPHLGCAIDFDSASSEYRCPCHRSAFAIDGTRKTGPAKRGLDPLPVVIEGDRVKVRFLRFKQDIADREPT